MRGAIVLAFDDAQLGTALAFSVLSPAGIVATVPMMPGVAGGEANGVEVLDWDTLDGFVAAGWELTNHTNTHPDLQTLSDAEVEDEIAAGAAGLLARGYPNEGHLHFIVPQHRTSETIRDIAMRHSLTNRDTSTTSEGMILPLSKVTRRQIKSRLFVTGDLATTFAMMDAAVANGTVAFIHTHGGDTNYWGQMRDYIVQQGYEGDCVTMTQLWGRYAWLWDRPQPLINAKPTA